MRLWILEYLASKKIVLASESNLSLATGLASLKVSLEPWNLLGRITALDTGSKQATPPPPLSHLPIIENINDAIVQCMNMNEHIVLLHISNNM